MSEIRKCEHCGNEFVTYPSQPDKFCNKVCFAAYFTGKPGPVLSEEKKKQKAEKLSRALTGRIFSAESLAKMSAAHVGHAAWNRGKKCPQSSGVNNPMFGKFGAEHPAFGNRHTPEFCLKLKILKSGDKSPFWKGGVSPINKRIRASAEYRNWRTAVFQRDNFTCQFCGVRGGRLQADHIKAFSQFPLLRFDLANGRTLCVPCHKQTPTYGNGSHA